MLRRSLLIYSLAVSPACFAREKRVVKIKVMANGTIFADGKRIDVDALDSELARLKKVEGAVWYYREHASGEPTHQSLEVVNLVVKHSLPISLSTRDDFSDYVDSSGRSVPRR